MLFHRYVFVPSSISDYLYGRYIDLIYTHHSLERKGINRPKTVCVGDFIEVEAYPKHNGFFIKKLKLRYIYRNTTDLIIVVLPNFSDGNGVVKTTWLTHNSDTFRTGDKSKYSTEDVHNKVFAEDKIKEYEDFLSWQ